MTSVNPGSSQNEPPAPHPHRELIQSLFELVGFLRAHPEMPIGRDPHTVIVLDCPADTADSDRIAFVRHVAQVLDVEPYWLGDTHFYATREFGKYLKIEARAILQAAMDEFARTFELGRQAFAAEKATAVAAADTEQLPAVVDLPVLGSPDADVAAAPVDGEQDTEECEPCDGSGSIEAAGEVCRSCWGTGRVLAEPPKCEACGGDGHARDLFGIATADPCEFCFGSGRKRLVVSTW